MTEATELFYIMDVPGKIILTFPHLYCLLWLLSYSVSIKEEFDNIVL